MYQIMKNFGLYDTNIQLFITLDFYTDILFKSYISV